MNIIRFLLTTFVPIMAIGAATGSPVVASAEPAPTIETVVQVRNSETGEVTISDQVEGVTNCYVKNEYFNGRSYCSWTSSNFNEHRPCITTNFGQWKCGNFTPGGYNSYVRPSNSADRVKSVALSIGCC
jgi:hypothetical protein